MKGSHILQQLSYLDRISQTPAVLTQMQNDLGAFLKLNQCYKTVLCQSKPDFCWAECNHLVKLMKVFVLSFICL